MVALSTFCHFQLTIYIAIELFVFAAKSARRYSNRVGSASCENANTSQRSYHLTVNAIDRNVIDNHLIRFELLRNRLGI